MELKAEYGCEYAFYDFGTVSTGSRAFKTVQVTNYRTVSQRYEINRDPDTNPLDHSFYVHPCVSSDIHPGNSFVFEIEYAPVVPFTICFDYFNVSDAFGVCYKFGLKGKSLGPLVEISNRELLLTCIGPRINVEKNIVLHNDSVDIARFQFDIDELHVFEVKPRQGIIKSYSSITATVKFNPPHPGVYNRSLFCLIQYQAPLMINVIGIYTYNETFDEKEVPLRQYPLQEVAIGGYENYVSDSKNIVENLPPVILSENCIDFGQYDIEGEQNLPQTVCVTNYIKTGVTVQWEEDLSGTFLIEPMNTRLTGDTSAIFEVYFRPLRPDSFYSRELTARIHWDEKTTHDSLELNSLVPDLPVPLTITLRLMGHTFKEVSSIWKPQYNIYSSTIRMPPCVPPSPVYNTFTIGKVGIQPLMFKFIPPHESRYVLKPMQGVIENDFQIIVVGVCPNSKEESSYFDRWILQFNGSQQYEITMDFCAYAEYPKIQINEDNCVIFPPTFPGTKQNGQVCLKNFSRHYIWYRFSVVEPDSGLWLTDDDGSIASNEITYITWQFVPRKEGIQKFTVTCDTCALLDCWCPFGSFVGTEIDVYTESEYTELVSFPSEIDCGAIAYKGKETLQFHLFNFGRCKIYFILKCVPLSNLLNFYADDIQISPASGKIEPQGKILITVVISPTHIGSHAFYVSYKIVANARSSKNVLNERIKVTSVQYECVLGQLQISDINYMGAGPTISKVWLWRMLDVNSLNSIMNEISPGETSYAQVNVPHAMIDSEPLIIYVLLRNISEVQASWNIKKLVTCNCVVREDHLTRRVFRHNCVHRDQICVHPVRKELEKNEEAVLLITVKYNVLGINESRLKLLLGFNRTIIISFNVHTLPPDICSPSVFSTSLTFQGIYIGELNPCIQAYWLYNNANESAFYSVDVKSLRKFNVQNMYSVITCINPSGTVFPHSTLPILFQFTPRVLTSYEVDVPICLGEKDFYNLTIKGEGVINQMNSLQPLSFKARKSSLFDMEEIPIFLSVDHILKGPFVTHGQDECLILMQNRSNISIGFSWLKYFLPDFLTCKIEPLEGTLQPREARICKVNIKSHSRPCFITVQIPCEFKNMNLEHKHKQAEMLFNEIQLQKDKVFTITEKGTFKPKCDIPLIPSPRSFYRVLALSCHTESSLEIDDKLSVDDQLVLFPPAEAVVTPRFTRNEPLAEENKLKVLRHVIDSLIWNTMFSKRFLRALENIKVEEGVYYGQFVMELREEKRLLSYINHTIPRNTLAKMIRDLIFKVFQEEFILDQEEDDSLQNLTLDDINVEEE